MQLSTRTIAIEVEDSGPRAGTPVLLIMGLGMQLTAWPDAFVAALAADGLRVIRFDNRDIGLSQGFDALGVPPPAWELMRRALGLAVRAPYTLDAMCEDAVALLDALGIERVHVCGVSMGGMIAQLLALRHPTRVASLTLAMTSTGARHLPLPRADASIALMSRPSGRDLDALVAHGVRLFRIIGSPAYPTPPAELEARIRRSIQRSYRPQGMVRQMLAIAAAPDRTARLRGLMLPAHIVHGLDDPLVPVAHGRQLAGALPGASSDFVAGVGHDLPEPVWQRLRAAIVGFASGPAAARARPGP